MHLWRAVDSEGEVLDLLVQPRRDTAAALRLIGKLLKKQGYAPDELVTDKLGSYGAARHELRNGASPARPASHAAAPSASAASPSAVPADASATLATFATVRF